MDKETNISDILDDIELLAKQYLVDETMERITFRRVIKCCIEKLPEFNRD